MSTLLRLVVCIYFIGGCAIITVDSVNDEPVRQVAEKSSSVKNVSKRYDIDVQTCVENFDIHKDKIIRTEDSRAMGAKYINEIDLGSREECLRLCCETSTCDVFVFEEKSPGSCYMFHCGSPDDFKCKFTKHHNYTSAVLAVNRQLSELEDQIRLTKHEQELSQLRKPESVPEQNTPVPVVAATPAVVTTAPSLPQTSNSSAAQGRRCSRYQFECRSSGECIAIYNACDGIPQCTDGSDEAPELDCPSPASTPSAAVALPPTARPAAAEAPLPQPQLQQPLVPVQSQQRPAPASAPGAGMQPQYRAPPSGWNQQQSPQQPVVPVQNLPQYPGMSEAAHPAVRSGKPYGESPGLAQGYNVPSSLQWSGFPQQQQPRQPLQPQQPPQPVQQQQQQAASYHIPMGQFQGIANHEYEDQNSHIFTHKGNGLVADSDRYNSKGIHPSRYNPAGQYSELPHEYNKYGNGAGMGGYYGNVPYRQPAQNTWQLPQQQQPNQPMAHDLSNLHALEDLPRQQKLPPENPYSGPPIPPDYYYEDSQEARYHPPPAHEQELVQHAGIPHGERESITDGATPIQVKHPPPATHQHHHKNAPAPPAAAATTTDNKHDDTTQEHKESVETHTKEQDHSTTVKPAAQKTTHEQHHTSHHRKHPQPEVSLEETGVVIEPIDGEAGKPSGAILSLSLGLCITVFMIILVACRLRLVRRRLRRGKSPYAHDADYLVNGMYL